MAIDTRYASSRKRLSSSRVSMAENSPPKEECREQARPAYSTARHRGFRQNPVQKVDCQLAAKAVLTQEWRPLSRTVQEGGGERDRRFRSGHLN